MKILIVEDNEENLYLLEFLLNSNGYEVVSAKNGVEALKKLKKDSIDMIISDILMPKMDGFRLCRMCKGDNELNKIPFVFYTATYTEKKDEEFALSLGAEKFIVKPKEADVFLKIIKNVIKEHKKGDLVAPKKAIEYESIYLLEYSKRIVGKLESKVKQLEREIIRRKKSESNLNERIKELKCLFFISQLAVKLDISIDQIFKEIVKLLLLSWQYPEITCSKIVFEEKEFKTKNFKKTKWKQAEDINIKGNKVGVIEVYYLEEKPEIYEGPFLKEERYLIHSVAEIISVFIESRQKEEELKHLSFHDKLTGLYNRFYIEEEIARLDTERQFPISLAMGDLNALKLINDAYGYRQGDKLLVRIAKILKKCSREEDIIARWGGDEFVILLPKTTEEDAVKLVERVRESCKKTAGQKIPASISIGVSTKTRKAQNIQDIIKEAEDRMYQRKLTENKSIQSSIISSLEATLWERSHETEKHGKRLKDLALRLGKKAKLAPNELDELALLSTLHDIGKIGIQDSILTKPEKLTKKEWHVMKRHPEIGYKIAQSSPQLLKIADGILYHHEWWDGTGYPHGLTGENIPVISRILAITDAYDVMTHNRVYKKAVTKKEAIKELERCSGTQFDPGLVKKFIEIVSDR